MISQSGVQAGAGAASRALIRDVVRCPACHAALREEAAALVCTGCNARLVWEAGVLRCTDRDDFYEQAYVNQVHHVPGKHLLRDWVFFHLVQSGVFGELRRVLSPGARVLDLGCASGIRWLGEQYQTIGVDVSFASVRGTVGSYALPVQARVHALPLADGCVDAIYGSYFFEHVAAEEKDRTLREIARVLRPGGSSVLLFDTLSDSAFGRFARRDPDAFYRGFVAPDGHIGLEPLSRAVERFAQAGLQVRRVIKLGATLLQYMSSYNWLDLAYGDVVPWVRTMGRLSRAVSASKLKLPVEWAITAFDRVVSPFASPDHATRAIVVASK